MGMTVAVSDVTEQVVDIADRYAAAWLSAVHGEDALPLLSDALSGTLISFLNEVVGTVRNERHQLVCQEAG